MSYSASSAALRLPNDQHNASGWPRWLLDVLLTILFVGPILSPLFRASGQPVVDATGAFAHSMMLYICPTPEQSYTLFGFPMAVCARCWGSTIGLWAARLLLPLVLNRGGTLAAMLQTWRGLTWPLRLLICALPFVLWPLEIVGTAHGWWALPPLWLLVINGAQAGVAAGLFACALWPGFWPAKKSSAASRLAAAR